MIPLPKLIKDMAQIKHLIGGLLGMATDDTRIRQSLEMAKEYGMEYHFEFEDQCDVYDHPNTTIVTVKRGESEGKGWRRITWWWTI